MTTTKTIIKKGMIRSLFLVLPTVLAIACSPTLKVVYDYDRAVDFKVYKTYSVFNKKITGRVSQLNEDRIIKSIKAEMSKKGYRENTASPDLLVNAVTVLKDKKYITANSNYYGYGGVYRPYGYWGVPGMVSGRTTVQTQEYKNGSLMLDVVDAKTQKLVWQGNGNADMENQPKNPEEAIQNSVTKIMASFPVIDTNIK